MSRPLSEPLGDWSDEALDRQFVSIRQAFVHDGRIAALWRADHGLSVSALPVFWLLGRGYPDGVSVRSERVAWLAGISVRSVKAVAGRLGAAGVLRMSCADGDSMRFALTGDGLWSRIQHGSFDRKTHFPSRIVTSELWRCLRHTEKVTLMVLAGVTTAKTREATISCATIAALCGISRSSASRALHTLTTSKPAWPVPPVEILAWGQEGTDIGLSEKWWDL